MELIDQLTAVGIVPVVEIQDSRHAVPLAEALIAAGMNALEVTFRTDAAADAICAVRQADLDLILLAGTVTEGRQIAEAQEAGADVLVAPGLATEIVLEAGRAQIPIFPGVATPSEINTAVGLGLDALKVFPAEHPGGPGFLRSAGGPFRNVRWNPSGGITEASVPAYLRLDSVIACSGTWIVPRNDIVNSRYGAIQKRAEAAMGVVRSVRPRASQGGRA